MSHKTLYIDVDEEITSIIDRMRKAQANEVIIVVPKQSMLIQSLVNLKLLKKEADRRRKKIMIVTQDRIGKKLIEKAGILVQRKENEDMFSDEESFISEKEIKKKVIPHEISDKDEQEDDGIGSSDYFEKSVKNDNEPEINIGNIRYENIQAKEIDQEAADRKRSSFLTKPSKEVEEKKENPKNDAKVSMSDIVMGPKQKEKKTRRRRTENSQPQSKKEINQPSQKSFVLREAERQKSIETDKFFQMPAVVSERSNRQREKVMKTAKVKGRAGKYFVFFISALIILLAAAAAYFYLPKATLAVELVSQGKSISANIKASTGTSGIDQDQSTIPAVLEKISLQKSDDFTPTGDNKTSAGKASGSVVIYNEFSADNQTLVATTRLETADGKIFRITQDVVVPGMTQVSGENNPGAIEVSVIADKAGEEYNIDPTDFKIVGFKGGPKYDKIYAKSAKAMTGGGGTGGGVATITAADIANAKEKLIAEAKQDAIQKLKDSMGANRKFFDDNVQINVSDSSSSDAVGAQVEKFTYNLSGEAEVLSYSEDDVKALLEKSLGTDIESGSQIKFDNSINYILSDASFQDGTLSFAAKTDATVVSAIDLDKLKSDVLGKNADELTALIKTYPAIKNAQVSFSPFFVNRVPKNAKRVNIEVK